MKKVRERDRRLKYERIGEKVDLILVGVSDASFKTYDKAVGGVFLFLASSTMSRSVPIY